MLYGALFTHNFSNTELAVFAAVIAADADPMCVQIVCASSNEPAGFTHTRTQARILTHPRGDIRTVTVRVPKPPPLPHNFLGDDSHTRNWFVAKSWPNIESGENENGTSPTVWQLAIRISSRTWMSCATRRGLS